MELKTFKVCLSLFIAACLPFENNCYAFPIAESNDDYFYGWTDDDFKTYEDSIRSMLYPPVTSYTLDVDTLLIKSDNQRPEKSLARSAHVPNSIKIDTAKEVGQIQINSDVSATGAKTYEVPIDVYPGIRGLEPHLSLVYDSHQGNSVVGMGWKLSGISSIARGGKNIFMMRRQTAS